MLTILYRPVYTVSRNGVTIELWVAQRKMPFLMKADALIVPVAPDLKMVFGIAKMARDYGADEVQNEANRAAPLPPGKAFIGTGARYRYKHTALAVVFDDAKRTSVPYITSAVRRSFDLLRRRGAQSVVFPDMSENLLTQPNWITDEQRGKTAELTAKIMIDTILACDDAIPSISIWVWNPNNAEAFKKELKTLENDWDSRKAAVVAAADEADDNADNSEPHDWVEHVLSEKLLETQLDVALGNPFQIRADALVHASSVTPGAELSTANGTETFVARLSAEGGERLVKEASDLGTLPIGAAGMTYAGADSHVKRILHLACRFPGQPTTEDTLIASIKVALDLAEGTHVHTLVFPNPGTDANDYPVTAACWVAAHTTADHVRKMRGESSIKRVIFVAENTFERDAFYDAVEMYEPGPIAPLLAMGSHLVEVGE